jgi:hypothetical protein
MPSTAKEWADKTDFSKLPERVRKKKKKKTKSKGDANDVFQGKKSLEAHGDKFAQILQFANTFLAYASEETSEDPSEDPYSYIEHADESTRSRRHSPCADITNINFVLEFFVPRNIFTPEEIQELESFKRICDKADKQFAMNDYANFGGDLYDYQEFVDAMTNAAEEILSEAESRVKAAKLSPGIIA